MVHFKKYMQILILFNNFVIIYLKLSFCEICNRNTKTKKKIDFWKLPEVLNICLKRFKYNKKEKKKINSEV